jgi:hypothetical protein
VAPPVFKTILKASCPIMRVLDRPRKTIAAFQVAFFAANVANVNEAITKRLFNFSAKSAFFQPKSNLTSFN